MIVLILQFHCILVALVFKCGFHSKFVSPTSNVNFNKDSSSFFLKAPSFPVPQNLPEPILHVCRVCNKSFKLKGNLNVHFRIHTGDYPFICSVCQKKFRTKQQLERHSANHNHRNDI
ncbi:hypothetical protein NPIL_147211 [Nephila pilipes]|uniref:C2H2-type domain-containing protein n=1 Tax=Nephila pilipes TaxID=299642 RepID=A0A8X6QUF1_NEPPI|nr:hypothetical protein NPIL_147211 [Nephila pilipes]